MSFTHDIFIKPGFCPEKYTTGANLFLSLSLVLTLR